MHTEQYERSTISKTAIALDAPCKMLDSSCWPKSCAVFQSYQNRLAISLKSIRHTFKIAGLYLQTWLFLGDEDQCGHEIAAVGKFKNVVAHDILNLFFAVQQGIGMNMQSICAALHVHIILVLVKKLEKLFIAPKVHQELHETVFVAKSHKRATRIAVPS